MPRGAKAKAKEPEAVEEVTEQAVAVVVATESPADTPDAVATPPPKKKAKGASTKKQEEAGEEVTKQAVAVVVQTEGPADALAPPKKGAKKEVVFVTERDVITRPTISGEVMKVISFNVNGLNAFVNNATSFAGLLKMVEEEQPDLLLLQETKLQEQNVPKFKDILKEKGYEGYFDCSKTKKGYAGTAMFWKHNGHPLPSSGGGGGKQGKQKTLHSFMKKGATKSEEGEAAAAAVVAAGEGKGVSGGLKVVDVTYGIDGKGNDEGRVISVETEQCFMVNVYIPNSGQKLERLQYRLKEWNPKFQQYLKDLAARKPTFLCGDLNVAHLDADIYNVGASHLKKQAGCTPEERDAQTVWLESDEWVDTFRHFYPDAKGHYSYWSTANAARPDNKGLRLDYFICPRRDLDGERGVRVLDSYILHECCGSDHCPIGLILQLV